MVGRPSRHKQAERRRLAVLAPALVLSDCASCRGPATVFETISERFTIHYPQGQGKTARDALGALADSLPRIEEDLRPEKTGGFDVWIYPNLREFHEAIGMPDAPDWVVGLSPGDSVLAIVSPSNPGPPHDYQGMLKVAVHELTHCVTRRLVESGPPRPG